MYEINFNYKRGGVDKLQHYPCAVRYEPEPCHDARWCSHQTEVGTLRHMVACEDNFLKDGKDGKERWLDHHNLRPSSEISMIQLLSAMGVTVSEHADMLASTLRLIACECSVNNRTGLSSHRNSDQGTMIVIFFVVTLFYVLQRQDLL